FLATQKESELPPGNPRLAGKPHTQDEKSGFDKLSPNGASGAWKHGSPRIGVRGRLLKSGMTGTGRI
ncbi:hypothetical protein, partial [Polaromonas sp.]|uniref:hypothetical protein n=1 Tax=Polaromonas sp. TaxID=1869339 RepID=UPI0024894450